MHLRDEIKSLFKISGNIMQSGFIHEIKSLFKISGNIMKSGFIQCKMIKKVF